MPAENGRGLQGSGDAQVGQGPVEVSRDDGVERVARGGADEEDPAESPGNPPRQQGTPLRELRRQPRLGCPRQGDETVLQVEQQIAHQTEG